MAGKSTTAADASVAEEPQYYTVLYGPYTGDQRERCFVDAVEFRGGVAHNVPADLAKQWLRSPKIKVKLLPNGATPAECARHAGITTISPEKIAAHLAASSIDAIFDALGPERAAEIAQAFAARLTTQTA